MNVAHWNVVFVQGETEPTDLEVELELERLVVVEFAVSEYQREMASLQPDVLPVHGDQDSPTEQVSAEPKRSRSKKKTNKPRSVRGSTSVFLSKKIDWDCQWALKNTTMRRMLQAFMSAFCQAALCFWSLHQGNLLTAVVFTVLFGITLSRKI